MTAYKAPLADARFIINELLASEGAWQLPCYDEFPPDLIEAVIAQTGRFCETVLRPLNRIGDEQGCVLENGVVRTPSGFKQAYDDFVEAGLTGIGAAPEHGGQGFPEPVGVLIREMLCSANVSFSMYAALSHGAYNAIFLHGSDEQKRTYLPHLVDGSWTGTMCLTEPHCGTDLGLVRTKAVSDGEDTYTLSGTKVFISAGEHDLSDNIIHLVLARIAGAPAGTRGISLFLVPKYLVNADGSLGARNAVSCTSIESKMGLHGSATCTLNFDEATGYLVGQAEKGMQAMFTMMNAARLAVGCQGVGIGQAAYQNAVDYALERLQGRALVAPKLPDEPADPLIVHPDVRRMLLTMRAYVQGGRALLAWIAVKSDIAAHHPQADVRRDAEEFIALLTPVAKAFLTDAGTDVANLAVQVYGGHGYIRDHGMEQYIRDARVFQIYEGANGVQAMDLVGRKLGADMGRYLRHFFHPVAAYLESAPAHDELTPVHAALGRAFAHLQKATGWIASRGGADPNEAGAAAAEYLRLFGLVALGFLWARMAELAITSKADDTSGFYKAKIDTARFYATRLLPQTSGLLHSIAAGGRSIMEFDDASF